MIKYEVEILDGFLERNRLISNIDDWDVARLWIDNGKLGVEYNFFREKDKDSSAIYKMTLNTETDMMETDYDTFVEYAIEFNKPNWEMKLIEAMYKACLELHI